MKSESLGVATLEVKVYAHRVELPMADMIMREQVVVERGGMRNTFENWMTANTYALNRLMVHDDGTSAVTIVCTDETENILVGIRKIKAPESQSPLEF